MVTSIIRAMAAEGNLREFSSEDGPIYCAACSVIVETPEGFWVHHSFFEPPIFKDSEGFNRPNMGARQRAEAFAQVVEERGYIQTDHWDFFTPPTLEESFAYEARLEAEERGQFFGQHY